MWLAREAVDDLQCVCFTWSKCWPAFAWAEQALVLYIANLQLLRVVACQRPYAGRNNALSII